MRALRGTSSTPRRNSSSSLMPESSTRYLLHPALEFLKLIDAEELYEVRLSFQRQLAKGSSIALQRPGITLKLPATTC
eukprot:4860775-Pyramimonas_sp.AAC.2